jgi:D-alanyl-D-alanine dipeptidase
VFRLSLFLLALGTAPLLSAAPPGAPEASAELIDIKTIDPTIVTELRYATASNIAGRAIYPPGMPALVRRDVAYRLAAAQQFLRAHQFGLKIWDAYRPKEAQLVLWQAARNNSYVADPHDTIGSMHTRGAAVDATLVDASGREVAMPTDFDNFTPAASIKYIGNNPQIRFNLTMLQRAMARAGFYGLRTEWWHFCSADWTKYHPVDNLNVTWQSRKAP